MPRRRKKAKAAEQHRPNCTAVSDQQLQRSIGGRWPTVNGITEIPFSFSSQPLSRDLLPWDEMMRTIMASPVNASAVSQMRPEIEAVMQDWVDVSQGKLRFVETNAVGMFARGIFFIFGEAAVFSSLKLGGLTVRRFDNNHHLMRAYVFLPYLEDLATNLPVYASRVRTMSHETGHAIGFDHLHDYEDVRQILNQTQDGVYCSVMPYLQYVSSNISRCLSACELPFAISPGPLDQRLVELTYLQGVPAFQDPYLLWEDTIFNVKEMAIFSLLFSSFHRSLYISSYLLLDTRKLTMASKNAALALADLGTLLMMLYVGLPSWMVQGFVTTSMLKYLPDVFPLPDFFRNIVSPDFSLHAFNFYCAHSLGQRTTPFALTSLLSWMGSYLGAVLPLYLLDRLAYSSGRLQFLSNPVTALYEEAPSELLQTEAQITPSRQASPAVGGHRFFTVQPEKPPRRSLCARLFSWFRKADTVTEERRADPQRVFAI